MYWRISASPPVQAARQNMQQYPPTTSMEVGNDPHHHPTTPDWNIQNTVIKTETIEDRNEDSGVSPGHYETSPSSSSGHRSYTPSSSTSLESLPMPSNVYASIPQNDYQNGDVPMEYTASQSAATPLASPSENADESKGAKKRTKTKRGRATTRTQKHESECPLCGFKTWERPVLWEHLKIHYNPNRIEGEPPVPTTLPIRHCSPEEIAKRITKHEDGINYPVINAQGKVKTNRCKICSFETITKVEFWRHIKIHTKVEKRLFCQYCPFVTDLKHHFEYHMNKQTGAKPFACKLCKYKCVNKSMLSSHMKSHTDVRQFSCSQCTYVTKYCHSLKMHLRKHRHLPGTILNPDGTVNYFITIDVYGTRRGPKQRKSPKSGKKGRKSPSSEVPMMQNEMNSDGSMPITTQSPQSSPSCEYQQLMMNQMPMVNPFSGAGLNNMLALQYNQLLRNSLPTTEPYANNGEAAAINMNQFRTNFIAEFMMAAERIQASGAANNQQNIPNFYDSRSYMDLPQTSTSASAQYSEITEHALQQSLEVLDLSKSANPTNNDNNGSIINNNPSNVENHEIGHPTVNQQLSQVVQPSLISPRASGTSRRKGRAVKLNRRTKGNNSKDGNENEGNATGRFTPESSTSSSDISDVNSHVTEPASPAAVSLNCNFCPISFGNEAMYAIHMGYHGYNDPYTCNICGQRCADSLSFNVHLSRSSHA